MLVYLSLTQSSNLQRLQLPTEHSSAPIQQLGWGGVSRGGEASVCLCSEEE